METIDNNLTKKERILGFIRQNNHFPALLINFLKNSFFGLLKLRGVLILIFILLFLYISNSFSLIYYKLNINITNKQIINLNKEISQKQLELLKAKKDLYCYQNQFKRIVNNQHTSIDFCKSK